MTGVKCDSSSFLSILAKIPKEEKNTIATQPKVGHRSTSSRYLRECREGSADVSQISTFRMYRVGGRCPTARRVINLFGERCPLPLCFSLHLNPKTRTF
jgi:hypothetical protein